jgi:ATP-dependent DNA helicase DinG
LFAESEGLFETVIAPRTKLKTIPPHLAEIRDHLGTNLDVLDSMLTNVPQASEDLRSLATRASGISTELETILSVEPGDAYACWVERRERSLMLHASPVEVGEMLRSRLYEKVPATVFTSATLSSGGNFDYFESCLGLDEDLHPTETILDSPFDYARQTLLYVPRGVPEPNSPGFAEAVTLVLEELLTHTGGRAFILFTSYKNMQTVHERMNGIVPFPLLIQGSKPKTRLLEEFRQRNGSVLFATSSFWEGVDVQGEALSCVIVDRLPFAPPDDPIVSARIDRIRKQGGSPFYSLQVPMAVIALKQGLGRLIRTRSDRGILCVLDIRLLTKSYGKVFRRSLYQSPLRRDPQAVEAFFSRHRESDGE